MNSFLENDFKELLDWKTCPNCGGELDYKLGECPYCRNQYTSLKQYMEIIESILLENINIDIPITSRSIKQYCTLYSTKKHCHSAIVDEFLINQKLEEKLTKVIDDINQKLSNNTPLNKEENTIYLELLKNNIIPPKKILCHLIMKYIFLKNPLVDEEVFLELVKVLAITTMKQLNRNRIPDYEPNCEIMSLKKRNSYGAVSGYNEMELDIENLLTVYRGKIWNFQIFFHEMSHIKDNIDIYAGEFNSDIVRHIEDQIIRHIEEKNARTLGVTPTYYYDNYGNISSEIDAEINGYIYLLRYFKTIGVNISHEVESLIEDAIKIDKRNCLSRNTSSLMNINDNQLDLDSLFLLMVEDYPFYLEQYPQLKIGYTVTDGKVRKKTLDELLETYILYKDNKEVTSYIESIIKETKPNNKKIGK